MRESFGYMEFLVVGLVGEFFIGHFLQNRLLEPTSIVTGRGVADLGVISALPQ